MVGLAPTHSQQPGPTTRSPSGERMVAGLVNRRPQRGRQPRPAPCVDHEQRAVARCQGVAHGLGHSAVALRLVRPCSLGHARALLRYRMPQRRQRALQAQVEDLRGVFDLRRTWLPQADPRVGQQVSVVNASHGNTGPACPPCCDHRSMHRAEGDGRPAALGRGKSQAAGMRQQRKGRVASRCAAKVAKGVLCGRYGNTSRPSMPGKG